MKLARLFSTSTRKAGYMPRPAVAQRDVAAEAIDRVYTTPSSLVARENMARTKKTHARPRRRRARARTSGFRARLQTPSGRKVLKLRRKKGRKYLAPAGAVNGWNREKKKSLK